MIKKLSEKFKENNFLGLNLNTQNKFIMAGWVLSTILILLIAWLVINNTQKKIFESYYNFGVMVAKTLAVESVDGGSSLTPESQVKQFKNIADALIRNNKDIAYIIFRNNEGDLLYSNKNNFQKTLSPERIKDFEISTPMKINVAGVERVMGSVQIGLTGRTMSIVGKTTRNSMIIIFTIAWAISIFAVLINTLLLTRQINALAEGVRRISSGEFGYKITAKDVWGEIRQLFNSFNDMSVRLRKYEEKNIDKLTYERNRFETVLMSIANGVVVCDNFDKIILVNNSTMKMFKVGAKDLVGTKIQDFCDSNGELSFLKQIEKFKNTPLEEIEVKSFEFTAKIDSGIIQTIISPMFSLNNEYQGYILVMHDITKEAEIDKMKDCFISNVSHELRTPVTVLRSYIETLHNYDNEFTEETKREFLQILDTESDRLNRMVNDILDFSRLESPNVQLEKALTDIAPILELTATSMQVLANQKDLSFSIITEPNLPKIQMNAESIERVMKNLISNAIKYSNDNGKIKIRAEVDRSGQFLEISVEDNGIGIPKEHMDKIFDRFYRVENNTHTIKGTGLGLHLVKIAIEKHHNGVVFAESEEGQGSKFGFKLPLVVSEEEWEISMEKIEG